MNYVKKQVCYRQGVNFIKMIKPVWPVLSAPLFAIILLLCLPAWAEGGDVRILQQDKGIEIHTPSGELMRNAVKDNTSWLEPDTDRPGAAYRSFSAESPEVCQEACAEDPDCKAYTYVKPDRIEGTPGRCYLKSAVPDPVGNDCCVSGVKPPSSKEGLVREVTPEETSGGKGGGGMVLVKPIEPPAKKGGERVRSKPGSQAKKSKAEKSPEPVEKNPPSNIMGSIDIEGIKDKTVEKKEDTGVTVHIQSNMPQHRGSQRQRHHGKKESKPGKRPSEEILESIDIGKEYKRQTDISIKPGSGKGSESPYEDILKALGRRKVASARAGSGEISKEPPSCNPDANERGRSSGNNQIRWTALPAISSYTDPALGAIKRDRIYIVAVAHTGCVYYSSTDSPGGWTPWQSIGTTFRADPSTPPVIIRNGNTLYLFVRGDDDNLHVAQKTGGNWSGWTGLTTDGSVRGRISVALTNLSGGRNLLEFHVVYRSENNAKKPTVVYLRFNSGWKQQGPGETWQNAIKGVIGTDGKNEIIAGIIKGDRTLSIEKKVRQASRWNQFDQIGGRIADIFDVSNIVFYAGAYHLAYSTSYVSNPEFGGGHVNAIDHTWIPRGQVDMGHVRTIADYTPKGNSHPKTTLVVYRNKLVAAYRDQDGFIRYAYLDTADPSWPWIGREIVDKGWKAGGRPVLVAFDRRRTLSGSYYENNNFGNDLFAAITGQGLNAIGFINLSRAVFIKEVNSQFAIYNSRTGVTCKGQGRADSPVLVADITGDGRPFYTEIGYVFWTMPNWLLGDAFKETAIRACMDKNSSGRFDPPQGGSCKDVKYPVMIGIRGQGGGALNICSGIWHYNDSDYRNFWEEMGHALAGHRLGFHDSGTKKFLKDKGKPYYPARENERLTGISRSVLKDGDTLFGKGVRGDRKCYYGTAPGGRCRGFTGTGGNYDVGTRQHSFIYTVLYYFADGDRLRQLVQDDLSAGVDLLQRKYNWVRDNIFRGVEFSKDNRLLIK